MPCAPSEVLAQVARQALEGGARHQTVAALASVEICQEAGNDEAAAEAYAALLAAGEPG